MKIFRALAREFVIFGLAAGVIVAVIWFVDCFSGPRFPDTIASALFGIPVFFGMGALAGFILWGFYRAVRFAVQG
jgi:hypothetical protein